MTLRKKIHQFLLKGGISQNQIENLYISFYKRWKRTKSPIVLFSLFIQLKTSKISSLEYSLKKKLIRNKQNFGDNTFYQSYPPLSFSGERDTEYRYQKFELKERLSKSQKVLDVGGNVGFLSLYISPQVQSVDVIDNDKTVLEIGEQVAKNQNIKNVRFIWQDFSNFKTEEVYDIILSLAVHKWIGLPFTEYIKRIHKLLKDGGYIFYETQNLEIDAFEEHILILKNTFTVEKIFDVTEKNGYKRKGCILRKDNKDSTPIF